MIPAKNIELLQNLAQFTWDESYYDLHNEFACQSIHYEGGIFLLDFKHISFGFLRYLEFFGVEMEKMTVPANYEELTLDIAYRGRNLQENCLVEFRNTKGYFCVEFCEGPAFEFWAEGVWLKA